MTVGILDRTDLNPAVQEQISELFGQLNSQIEQLSLQKILGQGSDTIFAICKENGNIIGIALMATYKVISGHKGMIEDVVVDSNHRRKGIGRKLMMQLLDEGKKRNLNEMLLFTGHHRLPAIMLYKSLGFQLKESGLYTFKP